MTNIEEALLTRAMDSSLRLRLSLSNRERLSAVITGFCRFDLQVVTGKDEFPISKKDISSISYPQPIIEPDSPPEAGGSPDRQSRSRVQDEFLARYINDKTLALLTMVNGEEYRGVIQGFDGFTILVKSGRGQMLVYKHGLLGIGPGYKRRERNN